MIIQYVIAYCDFALVIEEKVLYNEPIREEQGLSLP